MSGFVLTDWYTSGLLDLWVQHRAEWPSLRAGPFGTGHLRAQIDERAERQALIDAMRAALTTLDDLTAHGVIEALLEDAEWKEDPDGDVPLVWQHAVHLFEVAAERNLHVWADDRALGFLLWQYDTPVTGPVLDDAARAIRDRFDATSLVSTEMVLETFTDLPAERAAELGWGALRDRIPTPTGGASRSAICWPSTDTTSMALRTTACLPPSALSRRSCLPSTSFTRRDERPTLTSLRSPSSTPSST